MSDEIKPTGLVLLRAPFPPNQISLLPKPYKKDSPKGNCDVCGGYHGLPATHLDYVGHAALTDRLLDADPQWNWEPLTFTNGLPGFDQSGGLWIKLTVCGTTRLGYGHAADSSFKEVGSRNKEVIGDALRNAAMRFGAALDLWHKGDLHAHNEEQDSPMEELKKANAQQIPANPQPVGKRELEKHVNARRPDEAPAVKFSIPASVQARAAGAPKPSAPLFPKVVEGSSDLGSYIIKFGKHKDTMLSNMDIYALDGYIKYLHTQAAKDKKPLGAVAAELCEIGETYLKSRFGGRQPDPGFDPNEEIPF